MTQTNDHKLAVDAAMTPTGVDIDNDHANQSPVERAINAPEAHDSEHDDEAAQAQTVADDAIRGLAGQQIKAEDSEHGGTTNPAQIQPDDTQDVVDHMEQMESSGQIDMDAYRGERSDDDESGMLGEAGMEPGDLGEHGSPSRENDDNLPLTE